MEGKTLVLSALVMSLFMAHIQVDARTCCPSIAAKNKYVECRFGGSSRITCANLYGCKIISGDRCPYTHDIIENTGDDVNEYCKLGCVSSVCGALTTLQNSDASEIVSEAVKNCANACLTVCTKVSMNAVETA